MKEKILEKQKFKNFRIAQGLSQGEFANKLESAVGLIGMIESENQLTRGVTPSLKLKFKKAFKLDFDEDVSDDGTVNKSKAPSMLDNVVAIPFYNIGAAAGSGTYIENDPEETSMYFDKRYLKQILKRNTFNNLHVIYAQGDSMDSGWNQPDDIKDGDLLLVDTSQKAGNNHIFVIIQNNELRVKLLNIQGDNLLIISKNKKYKTEHYTFENLEHNKIDIVGRVVWNGSKENV